ncbi:MAG TPA: hydantoinase B/oxoprolinase family protein, partial [Planctomycetota bacterium]|nr:hydantoinase B/oxoprolinase family protein [Planctomycetota bacterium]
MSSASGSWHIWIDTGGTFTDCVAIDPSGNLRRAKVLSSSALRGTVESREGARRLRVRFPEAPGADVLRGCEFRTVAAPSGDAKIESFDPATGILELDRPTPPGADAGATFEARSPEEAPVLAARSVTGTALGRTLPPVRLRLATTRATNALLERRGDPVAFFVTRGFADLLAIGTQERPELFVLDVVKPKPIPASVVEVPGRMSAQGEVLEPLALESVETRAKALLESGVRSAAIALLHAHRNPAHERTLAELLARLGFQHVSASSGLSALQKIVTRARTAVVNAYLAPSIESYLARVKAAAGTGSVHVLTSAGGLVEASAFRPCDALLSGPAGGVCGAAYAARRSGFSRAITFDMGGTSTDVARWAGDFEYSFEHEVGGVRLAAPAVKVESVAAGGGSICAFDGHELVVGPGSAGASPGPACYAAGGPLTLTDVNLLLGRIDPSRFGLPIRRDLAEAALARLEAEVAAVRGDSPDRAGLLEGLVAIADERTADAIRKVSLGRGYDPAEHVLVAFGGAGGQHACAIAEHLGISVVLVPHDAGLLSALGLGRAVVERLAERQVLAPLEVVAIRLPVWLGELEASARQELTAEGVTDADVAVRRRIASLRLEGQDEALEIDIQEPARLSDAFREAYAGRFGHEPAARPIELVSLRVIASTAAPEVDAATPPAAFFEAAPSRSLPALAGGQWTELPVRDREPLIPGARLLGPSLVVERHGATFVAPGWTAEIDGALALVLRRNAATPSTLAAVRTGSPAGIAVASVELELSTNRFRTIVEEMGEMLRRTALSTNVKERLDFSCALLDAAGELVVNAPHIPVHLGALGLCVRSLRQALSFEPGDVVVTNHPAFGGSHLSDVTLVTPVFGPDGRLVAHVASRAHHAEIGGAVPGSMPPRAQCLAEEGVVIQPTYLLRRGRPRWEEVQRILESGPYPSRAVNENLADLRAALAANRRGADAVECLARAVGNEKLELRMAQLRQRAETTMRAALRRLRPGRREAEEILDDGAILRVAIDVLDDVFGGEAVVDFTGSAPVHPGNLNATPAVVRSAVLYVLRLLVDEPLPLNEGLLAPVRLVIPQGILRPDFPLDPLRAPAVFGGNVETSQRLVGLLLKALGLAASSQGTMNNVVFGNEATSYYETVCGGCGAGPAFDGASAVHSHMTNTRITDPEVIEHRYPVRLERFEIRRGSGG